MQIETMHDLPSFPFCSDRCKLIDLGRWIDGAYVIAGPDRGDKPGGPVSDDPEEANLSVPEPAGEDAEV
jgi:uncharacterized protein